MSNDKKSLIYMMSKQLYAEPIDKILDITNAVAEKFQIDANEIMLVFCMDILRTSIMVAKESGYSVDLHAYADAINKLLDESESNPEVN